MATHAPEIPHLKRAKEEKERRRGAFAWLWGGARERGAGALGSHGGRHAPAALRPRWLEAVKEGFLEAASRGGWTSARHAASSRGLASFAARLASRPSFLLAAAVGLLTAGAWVSARLGEGLTDHLRSAAAAGLRMPGRGPAKPAKAPAPARSQSEEAKAVYERLVAEETALIAAQTPPAATDAGGHRRRPGRGELSQASGPSLKGRRPSGAGLTSPSERTSASPRSEALKARPERAGEASAFSSGADAERGRALARAVPVAAGRTLDLGKISTRSRAMAQLRGMRHQLGAMRSGGPSAAEARASAASDQFEGVGGAKEEAPAAAIANETAPAQGGGAQPSTSGEVAVASDPSMPCTVEQLSDGWIVEQGACAPGRSARGANETPWQAYVNASYPLITAAAGLIVLASFLVFLAMMLIGSAPYLAAALYYAGVVAAAAAFSIGVVLQGLAALTAYLGGGAEGGLILFAASGICSAAPLALIMTGSSALSAVWSGLTAMMGGIMFLVGRSVRRRYGTGRDPMVAAVRG